MLAQFKTAYDQLCYVNKGWIEISDLDQVLKTQPAIPKYEMKLVQFHLLQIEKLLRKRQVEYLPATLQRKRNQTLDMLYNYALKGDFPKNRRHINRQPYFIDDDGTYCAVGYLMKMTGADEVAKKINQTQNFLYLADIRTDGLMNWVANSGFTFDELALIQPSYGGEWPSCITEMHYNNQGADVGEYIEIHRTTGWLVGMPDFKDVFIYDHLNNLVKSLQASSMADVSDAYAKYYQFTAGENFPDSGKIVIMGSAVGDTLFVYTYNSLGINQRDYHFNEVRNYAIIEDEFTQLGNSLTFCGMYATTWSAVITGATPGFNNSCTVGAVPLQLSNFNYKADSKAMKLNWQTFTEENTDYFELEKSSDGVHYSSMAKIIAAGNSTVSRNYSFTDQAPFYINQYRLKLVYKTGKYTYSNTLYAKFENAVAFNVMQNPVKSDLVLLVGTAPLLQGGISIYDISGRKMMELKAVTGQQKIRVNMLSRGKYLVSLRLTNGEVVTKTFYKE